jgi:HD-GYP domain-containing protein (c-di-GMP phosphodiesterase class II)/DNA-binding CsgD family transcriptional regulator
LAIGAEQRRDRAAPSGATGVRLAELLGRLSLAFDIANDESYGKGVRRAVLAVELGRLSGATDVDLHDTFWVSLLSYLGCTGAALEEVSAAGEDRTLSDTSIKLARIVGADPRILSALAQLGERERGRSGPLPGDALALPARLVQIAHAAEAVHQQHGQAAAIGHLQSYPGGQLDARLVQVFADEQADLFTSLEDPLIFDRFLGLEPKPVACADEQRVDEVAGVLALFADLRCPMFAGHSTGVAALAELAAGQLGLSPEDTRSLRRAALLHDIGRLGVPSSIWTRPGRLDWGEMERVRLHAYYTERVLSPIGVLGPVAEIAAAAHEHLDGSGYPQGRIGRSLLPMARILAVADMAVAMNEARPYRQALSPAAIARELVAEVSAGHLDASAADAVLAVLGSTMRSVPRYAQPVSDRELEVCRLIARGKMNKEIADVLGITLRTVQNHVAHIFDKLGVHSRSGVAVWLVESDFTQ